MANRALLHRKTLKEFGEWLEKDGWVLDTDFGDYQVLRARKDGRFLAVYDRHGGDHFSLLDQDFGVVKAFIRDRRIRLQPTSEQQVTTDGPK